MYAAHQGGQSLRTVCSAPRPSYSRNGQPATIRGLSESASLTDRQLVLTVTNPDITEGRLAEIAIRGASVKSIKATLLTAKDIYAHNSFAAPRSVQPVESQVANRRGGAFVHEFAPASVTRLQIALE